MNKVQKVTLREISFGEAMKILREKKGLTQGDIYRATGLERSYVSDLERGRVKDPRLTTVIMIARAIGVSHGELIDMALALVEIRIQKNNKGEEMNKAQKIIILITFIFILFAVIYPPYLEMRMAITSGQKDVIVETGWDWIFNLKAERRRPSSDDFIYTYHKKVRFDILVCEILAIGILAGFSIVLVKKKRGES